MNPTTKKWMFRGCLGAVVLVGGFVLLTVLLVRSSGGDRVAEAPILERLNENLGAGSAHEDLLIAAGHDPEEIRLLLDQRRIVYRRARVDVGSVHLFTSRAAFDWHDSAIDGGGRRGTEAAADTGWVANFGWNRNTGFGPQISWMGPFEKLGVEE